MIVIDIIEENQATLHRMKPHGFTIEEAHGTVRLTYGHGGIFVTNGGFIKLWTQHSYLDFYYEAAFETTEHSKPFTLTSEDIIELGNSNPAHLQRLVDRFLRYGYREYKNEN